MINLNRLVVIVLPVALLVQCVLDRHDDQKDPKYSNVYIHTVIIVGKKTGEARGGETERRRETTHLQKFQLLLHHQEHHLYQQLPRKERLDLRMSHVLMTSLILYNLQSTGI